METYKYLGILEADITKRGEMKEKIKKEYLRKTRRLLQTSGPEKTNERENKKTNKALHPRDNVDSQYVSR